MRNALFFVAFTVLTAVGCNETNHILGTDNSCEVCHPGCSNGVATVCLPLLPPGCGGQSSLQVCPNGCSADAAGGCSTEPTPGVAPPGCVASEVTVAQGALEAHGAEKPVAISTFVPRETRVVLATSAAAACAATTGTAAASGSGAILTLSLPPGFAGEVAVTSDTRLTTWKDGAIVIDDQPATGGTVTLSLAQPGGGTMGSYDVSFASGDERGTFVAPTCDICAR